MDKYCYTDRDSNTFIYMYCCCLHHHTCVTVNSSADTLTHAGTKPCTHTHCPTLLMMCCCCCCWNSCLCFSKNCWCCCWTTSCCRAWACPHCCWGRGADWVLPRGRWLRASLETDGDGSGRPLRPTVVNTKWLKCFLN